MVRFSRRAVPLLAVAAVATAGVADAAASTRHVTPDGAGVACTAAAPCAIETGVEGAAAGDEVVIAAGAYAAAAGAAESIAFPASGGVVVRGAAVGPGRPVVTTTGFVVRGAGSLLSDVEIRGVTAAAPLGVAGGARADRVLVRGAEGATVACAIAAGSITNSVCRGGGGAGAAGVSVSGPGAALRNVTAVSGGYGIVIPSGDAALLANTIADGAADEDLHRTPGLLAVSLDHCYAPVLGGGGFSSINRLTAGLAFRDDPADLRQSVLSATVDAGATAGAGGELDLNGNLRIVGGRPDIGAYEQVPAPAAGAGAVEAAPTEATVRPVVTTGGGRAQVTVRYGTHPGIPTHEVAAAAPAAAAPGAVEVPLAGLAPATTYHYRVTVTTDGGSAESAPASFTTPARPASATLGAPTGIGRDRAALAGTVDTGGAGGAARFELRPAGGGLTIETPEQALSPADGHRPVAAGATGLAPGTEYRVVLVLITPAGTVRSAARSLTTLGTPPGPAAAPPDPRDGSSPDTRRPRVAVRAPAAVRIGRRDALVARVTCDEPCTLTARARLAVRGGPPARFRLLPGARITLRLRPVRRTRLIDVDDIRLTLTGARRAALTALRAGRRVVVRVDVQARDAAGNLRRVTRFVAVRP